MLYIYIYIFFYFGYPKQVRCDGGAKFLGHFVEFCEENQIAIERASAYNPTSNSSTERNLGILIFFYKICTWR